MYSPNGIVERRYLWDELVGVADLLWCIEGDFNIWSRCERLGDSRQSTTMLEFSKFTFDQGLIDIPLIDWDLVGLIIVMCSHGLEETP